MKRDKLGRRIDAPRINDLFVIVDLIGIEEAERRVKLAILALQDYDAYLVAYEDYKKLLKSS